MATATMPMPVATTTRLPHLRTQMLLVGASTIITADIGSRSAPALTVE